jgi:Protein of unknown function (DUF1579)
MTKRWMAAAATFGLAVAMTAQDPSKRPTPAGPPSPELEKLAYFVGPWMSEGELKATPESPGGPTQGRDMCRWLPGNHFLGCMMQSKSPMGVMQVEAIMGYDADKKVYRFWSFDNLGQAETSTGTFANGAWTWRGESKMGAKTFQTRYTMSNLMAESYAFTMETSGDGKTWAPMLTGTVKRPPRAEPTPARVDPIKPPAPKETPGTP